MENIIGQIANLLAQGITAIIKFLQLIWTWSFGQIVAIFQSDFQSLPVWKLVILIIAIAAIAYFIYKVASEIWTAVVDLFKAFLSLLSSFVMALPWILVAGVIAFAAGWVINSVNI